MDYVLMSEGSESMLSLSALDETVLTELNSTKAAGFSLQRGNVTAEDSDDKLDITYLAIDPTGYLNPDGALTDTEGTIVLDDSFQAEGIETGDTITDTKTGETLTVTGFVKDAMYGHVAAGYVSLSTWKNMSGAQSVVFSGIALQADKEPSVAPENTEWITKSELIEHIPGYSAEQMTIRMILWVLLVVSAAILGVFFYILTIQKKKQFGVMKAIGLRMGEINAMLLSQILILSVIGVALGNLLTFGMSMGIPKAMPFYLKGLDSAGVSLIFVAIAVVFGMFSMIQIQRVDPLNIIGGSEE